MESQAEMRNWNKIPLIPLSDCEIFYGETGELVHTLTAKLFSTFRRPTAYTNPRLVQRKPSDLDPQVGDESILSRPI